MTDDAKRDCIELFRLMVENANKFAFPITPMECMIVAHLVNEWAETREIPAPEQWDQYDYEIDLDEAVDEETAPKN
jgi:hypothetical protein